MADPCTPLLRTTGEEEPQLEAKSENNRKMSQARPGRRPARWDPYIAQQLPLVN